MRPLTTAVAVVAMAVFFISGFGEGRSSDNAQPAVTSATTGPCLLPAPDMRRRHKDLLFEERTKAVRQGDRNPEASLSRCITCHAVFDEAAQPIAYDDERHFCRACHLQVAVAPDCFTCHRSTPVMPVTPIQTGGTQ